MTKQIERTINDEQRDAMRAEIDAAAAVASFWDPDLPAQIGPFSDPSWQDKASILATIEFLGVPHHVILIRVHDDEETGCQEPDLRDYTDEETEVTRAIWDDVTNLYDDTRYQTVELPGIAGEWVVIVHPYGA